MGFIKIIAAAAVLFAVTAAAPMETAAQELYENQIFTAKIRNSSGQNLYSSDVIIDIDFLSAGGSSWQDDTAQVEYSVFYGPAGGKSYLSPAGRYGFIFAGQIRTAITG